MLRRLIAPLLSAALLLTACVEPPTAPTPGASADASLQVGGLDLTGVLEFASLPLPGQPRSAAKYIRAAEGGFVELRGFRVDIPAGALPQDTLVTIDLPADAPLAKHVLAEFGPHGVQFNTPVTLRFPLQGTLPAGGPIGVARWENGAWTPLGGWVEGTTLSGTTPHFSTYSARKDVFAGG